jgi:hypothetical protein
MILSPAGERIAVRFPILFRSFAILALNILCDAADSECIVPQFFSSRPGTHAKSLAPVIFHALLPSIPD